MFRGVRGGGVIVGSLFECPGCPESSELVSDGSASLNKGKEKPRLDISWKLLTTTTNSPKCWVGVQVTVTIELLVEVVVGKGIVTSRASHQSSSVTCSLGMWTDSNHFLFPRVQKKWTLPLG